MEQLILHEHYLYRMRFNSIRKLNYAHSCNLLKQLEIQKTQQKRKYWVTIDTDKQVDFVACCSNSHCCLVEANVPTVPASSATSEREYNLIDVSLEDEIGLTKNGVQFIDNKIFDCSQLVPLNIFRDFIKNLRSGVLSMWQSRSDNLPSIVNLFDQDIPGILSLDKEDQFNSWVFKRMENILSVKGFSVETEVPNNDIYASCCEFSSSKPDCLIYYGKSVFKSNTVLGMTIAIDSDSNSDVNIDDIDDMNVGSANGCAFEMKRENINAAAINECMYNMFGAGTKLAIRALRNEKIVDIVNMYGVVATMVDPMETRLLKLKMDFTVGRCTYYLVQKKFSFAEGVNMILNKLNQ